MEDWKRYYHGDTEGTKEARRWNNSIIRKWKNGRMEKWKNLMIRQFENSTMEDVYHGDTEDTKEARRWNNSIIRQFDNGRVEGWNVEALAEIPLRREKNGRCLPRRHGGHKGSTKMGQFDN